MTDKPDGFRRTRLVGGTEAAERVLAWAGTELTRRQNQPLEGDEPTRQRWDQTLVVYVEEMHLLSERGRAQVARLAREGRPEAIIVTIRSQTAESESDWVMTPVSERFDPPLEPMSLDQIKTLIDAMLIEMEDRRTKKGRT